ncbi:hypothetical protein [Sinomonas sp. R1AF57]|uniref:hypothetical protein n=1 Tax=Sinomonas sp. R1AF57 TaxID=2020377 RepID=UPI000B5DE8ED|nr:hypothetical protein [Sinomonas sp. R1AF57]ASN52498.1 hypothetical protein CGQ25_10775 [Sinomonas sp. R1AF57]
MSARTIRKGDVFAVYGVTYLATGDAREASRGGTAIAVLDGDGGGLLFVPERLTVDRVAPEAEGRAPPA